MLRWYSEQITGASIVDLSQDSQALQYRTQSTDHELVPNNFAIFFERQGRQGHVE